MVCSWVKEQRPFYRCIGVDFSANMVAAALNRHIYENVFKYDLSQGLPPEVQRENYDVIFAIGCLEFVSNLPSLLSQIHDHLLPEGRFWLTLLEKTGPSDVVLFGTRLISYSEEEAKALLADAGFRLTDFERCPAAFTNSITKSQTPCFLIIAEK
jgi:predicted TPR repeat methyltransferase